MIIKAFDKTFDLNNTDDITNKHLLIELSEQLTKEQKKNNDLYKIIDSLTAQHEKQLKPNMCYYKNQFFLIS